MKIAKKQLKRIKRGSYSDLLQAIEYLLDNYNEDKFDLGYHSCLDDLSVRSQRLAEHINEKYITITDIDGFTKFIEDYYKQAIKEE